MAMLDVTCEHCGRQFRVRGEFAGKSTRCPGCSKPLTIGAAAKAAPPREEYDDAPRPRRREPDPEPTGVTGNWKRTAKALGSEQAAVRFLGVQVLADLVAFCLMRGTGSVGQVPAIVVMLFLILIVGPGIMTVVMGLTARFGAVNIPPEAKAGGTAWASVFCALGGMLAMIVVGFGLLISIEGSRRDADPVLMAGVLGGFVMTTGAVVTFAAMIAQIGIATGSREISAGIGRMGVGFMVCLLISVVLGGCGTVMMEGLGGNRNYGYGPNYDGLFAIFAFTSLITAGIMLVLYHSLLGSAKKALQYAPTRG